MQKIYEKIGKATAEQNKKLRESLRAWLVELGENTNRPELSDWARKLSDEGLEMCLHFGFSERALLETFSGVVSLRHFSVKEDE